MAKTIVFRSNVKRARNVSKQAWEAGIKSITEEVEREIKALINTPYPPASRPLRPSHKRTGNMQSGYNVRVQSSSRGRAAQLVVENDEDYAPHQEYGTVKMAPRPHVRVVLLARGRRGTTIKKKWVDKIARSAQRKSKTKAKTSATKRRRP